MPIPIDAFTTLILLITVFTVLAMTTIPASLVFVGALTLAITFKLAPVPDLLGGFSNQGMLTVAALFVVAAGMYSTGAVSRIIGWIVGIPKKTFTAQIKMLPAMAAGSAFLNNTPLIAMMIPMIRDLSRSAGLYAKRLYMPLSFASIMGGTCTVIGTSTNLIIAGLVVKAIDNGGPPIKGLREIQMFDSAWPGVPVAVAGIPFLIVFSRFLLPESKKYGEKDAHKKCYSAEFRVKENTPLAGKSLKETGLFNTKGLNLQALKREGKSVSIDPDQKLAPGDRLAFTTEKQSLIDIWRYNNLHPHHRGSLKKKREDHILVTVVVSDTSLASHRKIKNLPAPESPYRFRVIAISRNGECLDAPQFEDIVVQANDTLILEVDDSFLYHSQIEKDFALTQPLKGCYLHRTHKSLWAGLITLGMITAAAFGVMTMLNAALLAGLAMLMTGCLTFRVAAQSIDWETLVVIACAVGLGAAVTETGLADTAADLIIRASRSNPMIALAAVFTGTSLMTNVVTNNAAAAFMFPIALSAAQQLEANAMPFIITLMISASCAFITPTGYQTNMMVWGPGGYAFTDYVKLGLPLTVLVGIMTVFLVPLLYHF